MTIGRSAGEKTCDDCGKSYAGPAYYTFLAEGCVTEHKGLIPDRPWNDGQGYDGTAPGQATLVPHIGCTENLCPDCAGPHLEPDRPGDERRVPA